MVDFRSVGPGNRVEEYVNTDKGIYVLVIFKKIRFDSNEAIFKVNEES